ncbi:MAG: AAA family ATPase [Parabacteroides sp.]|nr:AAA family ATPase [bacterium]MDY4103382.1 AAA family ATPase [Parabacteroides sp.]
MEDKTNKGNVRQIPYGMMNFVAIREDNYYYVDKTRFIEKVENSNRFFFFIRPRRFGKSLTMSMLHHYYDILDADKFERLYGDLYIGQHPTPNHNKYLVIYLNFAVIDAELGNYRSSMDSHCRIAFTQFCKRYAHLLPPNAVEGLLKEDGAVKQLDYLYRICSDANQKIYLFIDEYDHFTNNILSDAARLDEYKKETHGTGYLRTFFDTIKSGTYSSIERVFVTGVSPVTLDDLTSGFNIGTNYSLSYGFNEMVGFTEQEVREMLTYYSLHHEFHHTVEELIEIMKPYYDNYCFALKAYGKTTMYNSNMVLSFLYKYIDEGCEIPQQMLDENIRVDYNKLRMLIRKDKEFAHDASIIQTLVSQGFVTGELKEGFPAENIVKNDNFISLLYYFGLVTIGGFYQGDTKFTIPNEVVREQIFTYLLEAYEENDLSFESYDIRKKEQLMAYCGEFKPFFQYIADSIYTFASQRDRQKGEAFVHGYTLALTSQCRFYRPISELDNQNGYADIFLRPLHEIFTDMEHSYIIELKYLKSQASEAEVKTAIAQAQAQVCRYADTVNVNDHIGPTRLHKVYVVYRGVEMVACEEVCNEVVR